MTRECFLATVKSIRNSILGATNFLEVLQIGQSIPSRWKEAIYGVKRCLIDTNVIYCNNGKLQDISKTTCKDVYWNFVTKRRRIPKCSDDYPNFNYKYYPMTKYIQTKF